MPRKPDLASIISIGVTILATAISWLAGDRDADLKALRHALAAERAERLAWQHIQRSRDFPFGDRP